MPRNPRKQPRKNTGVIIVLILLMLIFIAGSALMIKLSLDLATQEVTIRTENGDTITLLADDKKYRIRFYGIDAPEAQQTDGICSRNALREKILGKEVTVTVKNLDRYGRAVGKVAIGGRDINLEMIREGHAWYYADYARNEYDLYHAQQRAREEKTGLWKNPDPQPPWQYRQKNNRDK